MHIFGIAKRREILDRNGTDRLFRHPIWGWDIAKLRRAAKIPANPYFGPSKLRIRRRHEQQRVTGLVVNDGVRLPRRTRRWLRAVEHRLASGRPATLTPEQLAGWNALRHMVDRQAGGVAKPRAASANPAPGQVRGAWVMEAVEHDGPAAPGFAAQEGPSPVVWVFGRKELRVAQGGREGVPLTVWTGPRNCTRSRSRLKPARERGIPSWAFIDGRPIDSRSVWANGARVGRALSPPNRGRGKPFSTSARSLDSRPNQPRSGVVGPRVP